MLPETIISPYMYEKATYNSLETQTLLLQGDDLSQLLQSLIHRIKELKEDYETKLSTLEARLLALETKPVFQN
jgi:hypothetical protein